MGSGLGACDDVGGDCDSDGSAVDGSLYGEGTWVCAHGEVYYNVARNF